MPTGIPAPQGKRCPVVTLHMEKLTVPGLNEKVPRMRTFSAAGRSVSIMWTK
jgi:hypothetical protein